jgi:hypothetical protein
MRLRQRVPRDVTAISAWRDARDELIDRYIRGGNGLRPEGWWLYESARPDLAADAGHDVYAHLREEAEPYLASAIERLRFLRDAGELRASEIAAIHEGAATERSPGAYAWRSRVLREGNR